MKKQEIENIIAKYNNLAITTPKDEQEFNYERFVGFVKRNFQQLEKYEFYKTEEDVLFDFKQQVINTLRGSIY